MSREGSSTEGSSSGQACEQDGPGCPTRTSLRGPACPELPSEQDAASAELFTRVFTLTLFCATAPPQVQNTREDLGQRAPPACRSAPARAKGKQEARARDSRASLVPRLSPYPLPRVPGRYPHSPPRGHVTSGAAPRDHFRDRPRLRRVPQRACAEGEGLRASGESRGGFPTSARVFPLNPGTPTPRVGQPSPTAASGSPSPHGNSAFRSVLEEPVY